MVDLECGRLGEDTQKLRHKTRGNTGELKLTRTGGPTQPGSRTMGDADEQNTETWMNRIRRK